MESPTIQCRFDFTGLGIRLGKIWDGLSIFDAGLAAYTAPSEGRSGPAYRPFGRPSPGHGLTPARARNYPEFICDGVRSIAVDTLSRGAARTSDPRLQRLGSTMESRRFAFTKLENRLGTMWEMTS